MKPLVYVAGPITQPNPMVNTRDAVHLANRMRQDSIVVPFVPHLSILWECIAPMSHADWLAYDFDVLRHCDALYRIVGESIGADKEVAFCHEELGIPVFIADDLAGLYSWATGAWRKAYQASLGMSQPSGLRERMKSQ